MWLGTLDGLFRYDGHRLLRFRSGVDTPDLLMDNEITCLAEDGKGRLLIGTNKGINVLDMSTYNMSSFDREELRGRDVRCIHVLSSDGSIWVGLDNRLYRYNSDLSLKNDYGETLPADGVNSMYEDSGGNLWIMIWEKGLFKYIPGEDKFVEFPPIGSSNNPFRVYEDSKHNYWIGTWGNGLFRFFPDAADDEKYRPVPIAKHDSGVYETNFFSIVQDDNYGYIWLVSYSGLYVLKYEDDDRIGNVDVAGMIGEANNIFSEMIKDRDGNLWVGTFSEGAFMINFDEPSITNLALETIKSRTGITPNITVLHQDAEGDVWINQNRWGFGVWNAATGNVKFYQDYPALRDLLPLNELSCIADVGNEESEIWLGTMNNPSIYVVKKQRDDIELVDVIDLETINSDAGNPRKIFLDRRKNIWITTTTSLFVKLFDRDDIIHVSSSMSEITDITEDGRGDIWISSRNSGIYKVNKRLVAENYSTKDCALPSDNIGAICADITGRVWIGTGEGAVIVHDILTGEFKDISSTFHATGGSIFNIVTDNHGHIWISTNKRIIEFNPENTAVKEYSGTDDDVLVNSFLVNSYFKNTAGEIMYGGNRGISIFSPTVNLLQQAKEPEVRISDVKIDNVSIFSGNDNFRYDMAARSLVFAPGDKNIEIDFSALNYENPEKMRYAYKMSDVDDDWVWVSNRDFAVYNRLKRGHYTFNVRAMDENGMWSSAITRLEIYKRPAFYESWWAWLVYILLSVMIVHTAYRIARNRIKLKNDLRIAQIEREKSEELTQTKLRYFTNISHDFLTPLTVLSCMIDDAEMTDKEKVIKFEPMRSNINRLRRLLQQVLDFRKVESGNMKIRVSSGDIAMFIRDVCHANFVPLMKKKRLDFSFASSPLHIQGWFDADKMDKIIFNLLSNAFKYTPEGGKVEVSLNKYIADDTIRLAIRIKDSGIGISQENLENIFTRFYTSNKMTEAGNSNGIGLNLTKDLVELHHGTISVECGEGTIFTVDIPIDRKCYTSDETDDTVIMQSDSSIREDISRTPSVDGATGDMRILVVEDNEELLSLMGNILSKNYRVLMARNGVEALSMTGDSDVDIIVSDVMMPKMDGLELCRTIKSDIETSHIPVILLTAKNSTEDRIECYNAGADGYITKPFELKVLDARIRNFISNKRVRQQKFQSAEDLNVKSLDYPSADEEFLNRAMGIIEEHISDSEFDIGLFADKLCLSKSTLYRKLKTMTGLSPVEFIRNIRLKHACRMLEKPSMSVAEVAYVVGFSDPNYFALCFKTEFGTTPSDYRKR
jgi:signal transduction histidine kinase/DNA-binding response OmpR family regulator/ligand-binding sensor domain-containing protein